VITALLEVWTAKNEQIFNSIHDGRQLGSGGGSPVLVVAFGFFVVTVTLVTVISLVCLARFFRFAVAFGLIP
jgi:hypothetical protein